jgi:hypothetical protein
MSTVCDFVASSQETMKEEIYNGARGVLLHTTVPPPSPLKEEEGHDSRQGTDRRERTRLLRERRFDTQLLVPF